MDGCAVKRGFFALRNCGGAAAYVCANCQRRMCTEHLSMVNGAAWCVECAARRDQWDDTSYPYYYRTYYYSTGWYSPHYHTDTYYDDQDYRAFDKQNAVQPEIEEGGTGLVES